MAKNVHDNVLDAALNHIKSNATRLVVMSAEPTGATAYTMAQTNHDSAGGNRLAEKTITSANFTGPADGTTSGRKLTVNAASSMSINGVAASADATHVALVQYHLSSAALQNVLYTTTCTSQSLTGGNKVNTPSWEIEIRDPA